MKSWFNHDTPDLGHPVKTGGRQKINIFLENLEVF